MSSNAREIPPIASLSPNVATAVHYTDLSCAFASSLGVVRRMTWEQNPWVLPRISAADSEHISMFSELCLDTIISREAIQYAVLIGSTYATHERRETFGDGLRVYVVFPNLKRNVWKDSKFIAAWHNEIVLPAFDTAWQDSGLTPVAKRGEQQDCQTRNHQGLKRQHWPDFDEKYEKEGLAGKPEANDRWGFFDEAWKSITGMLEGVAEFGNPLLLLVNKTRWDLHPDHEAKKLYGIIGRQWDMHVDSRFIVPGSFRVVLQSVLGDGIPCSLIDEDEEGEAGPQDDQRPIEEGPVEEGAVGVEFKRMAPEQIHSMRPTKRPRRQMTPQCSVL